MKSEILRHKLKTMKYEIKRKAASVAPLVSMTLEVNRRSSARMIKLTNFCHI